MVRKRSAYDETACMPRLSAILYASKLSRSFCMSPWPNMAQLALEKILLLWYFCTFS